MRPIDEQLDDVRGEIKAVEKQVQDVEAQLATAAPEDKEYLREEKRQLRAKELILLQQENGAANRSGAAGPGPGSTAGANENPISQVNDRHCLLVGTCIDLGDKILPVELLVDTGCSLELLLPESQIEKLKVTPEAVVCNARVANGQDVIVRRCGSVLVYVEHVTSDGVTVLGRSGWLELWAMAGTGSNNALQGLSVTALPRDLIRPMMAATTGAQAAPNARSTGGALDGAPVGALPNDLIAPTTAGTMDAEACAPPVFKLRLSPVKRGKDKFGHDAILGLPGMRKLSLGIDRITGSLCMLQERVEQVLASM